LRWWRDDQPLSGPRGPASTIVFVALVAAVVGSLGAPLVTAVAGTFDVSRALPDPDGYTAAGWAGVVVTALTVLALRRRPADFAGR
jgi:branched-subunit amino acid ABC-type transport system permease component